MLKAVHNKDALALQEMMHQCESPSSLQENIQSVTPAISHLHLPENKNPKMRSRLGF
jgi:hypothetical protein